jgi:hypothetical protein
MAIASIPGMSMSARAAASAYGPPEPMAARGSSGVSAQVCVQASECNRACERTDDAVVRLQHVAVARDLQAVRLVRHHHDRLAQSVGAGVR